MACRAFAKGFDSTEKKKKSGGKEMMAGGKRSQGGRETENKEGMCRA